jgi:hypothetical protein
MAKIQTLAEMEAENTDGFRNPVMTPDQEAKHNAIVKAKREYEAIHTPIEIVSEDDAEENEDEY